MYSTSVFVIELTDQIYNTWICIYLIVSIKDVLKISQLQFHNSGQRIRYLQIVIENHKYFVTILFTRKVLCCLLQIYDKTSTILTTLKNMVIEEGSDWMMRKGVGEWTDD